MDSHFKYIKEHLKDIQNNEWYKVFPISILEDIMDFENVNEIYSLSEPLLLKLCPLGHRYKSRVAKASLKKPFYYC